MGHLFGQTIYFCLFDTYWKIQLVFPEQHVQWVEKLCPEWKYLIYNLWKSLYGGSGGLF